MTLWTDNLVFNKSKSYLNLLYKYWRSQKAFSSFFSTNLYNQVLTVRASSTHQWVRVIPGQIVMVKQVNIHVYSIEVRHL